jgi:cell division protein FtsB
MTFIQPNKKGSLMNTMLVLLCITLGAEMFGMVALYNATVNLNQDVVTAKAALDALGAQGTKLNNQILATLNSDDLSAVAAQDGLVADAHPQYLSSSWPIASQ